MSRATLGFLVLFGCTQSIPAAEPLRFRFTAGQVMNYSVRQTTTVQETLPDDRAGKSGSLTTGTTTTKLGLTRKWEVKAVDAQGVATLEMAITELRQEIIRPGPADQNGKPTTDTIVLDSTTAEGRKQMAEYLNKPIVTVKLDPRGQLIAAQSTSGASHRLTAELPFRFTLPEAVPH
ncbi:MAG: hypothetical protein LC104_12925, partial [Bacteroidales bacterium]|nr:hypothetical protein [Bacteroidales bacterium]